LNNKVTNLFLAEKQWSGKTKEVLTSDYNSKTSTVSFVKYLFKVHCVQKFILQDSSVCH